ncbi:MAG: helix-hairpin-helix domain-containing protein [Candidatus Solibacter sp.]
MIRYLNYLRLPAILCGALAGSAFAQLPEAPGKAATMQLCGNCHEATIVQQHRQSRDEWVSTIQKMMASGAEGTEDQFMAVLQYLTKNFGPVAAKISINQAPAAELETGLGITAKEAAAIVAYRTDKGAFKALDDLKKVPDLDFKKIEAQKDRVAF